MTRRWLPFLFSCLTLPGLAAPPDLEALLQKMTLAEKLGQLQQFSSYGTGPDAPKHFQQIKDGQVGSILNTHGARLTNELQKAAVESSRLKIPILFGHDVIHGHRTIFPVPLGEAASFDPKGCEESAAIASDEAAATGIRWTFAPMVDVARDARWGRVVEGAGEDTYLGCALARARVRGFQRSGRLLACAKHWVAYGAAEAGRDYNTVDMSERTLREIYFPPFKACVDEGVGTFMSSFNEIGGVPSTANPFTLTKVLRGEWGFQGFVVSDYESVQELRNHGFAADGAEAAQRSLNAGLDMEMVSEHIRTTGEELVRTGRVKLATIDEAVRRILRMKARVGLFDHPYTDESKEQAALFDPAHRQAARRLGARCMVLLKNDRNTLPFAKSVKNVALIGPLGDSPLDVMGSWCSDGRKEENVSVLAGLKNNLPGASVTYVPGCDIDGKVDVQRDAVRQAVAAADVVLLAVGERANQSGECTSRSDIGLPGRQTELIQYVHSLGKPYAVVLLNGRPLTLGWVAENCPSILEAWFPGSEAGNAIADVVFGDVNPAGHLPMSFPRRVGQLPLYYNHKNTGRPRNLRPDYTSSYIDVENTPQFPFGHGLSYTTFAITNPALSAASIPPSGKIQVTAQVQNTGSRAGDEVVQLYIRDLVGSTTRPVRELRGFERISLAPGETKAVRFTLGPAELGVLDEQWHRVVEPGQFEVYLGDSSAAPLAGKFEVR